MPRSRLAPAAALGAALAATVTTLVLSPAVAGGGVFVTGQLASAAALSPGSQRTAAVEVTNGRDHPVALRLRVEDVVEDEGGCLRQEGDVPGEECEGDGGELGRDLWLGVEREGQLLWQGGIDDLRGGVDLATLPRDLMAAQLFGSVRGAYTGSVADRKGAFEAANNGTLFLDEVGNLPEEAQRMLLTVLQEGVVTRLGDTRERRVDVKLVVATLVPEGSVITSNARSRMDALTPRHVGVPDVRDHDEEVFTGNVDLEKLEQEIAANKVAFMGLQAFADGQHPFSMANLLATREVADRHGLRLILDGSRVIENAWYIQRHETGYANTSIADLVRRMVKTAHVFVMDGAQDPKCNTGGILTTDNPNDYEKFMNEVVVYEGLHTYGGMAGRTMEVLARGIGEMCNEDEVEWVMHQTERFSKRLRDAGVPLERGCDGAYIKAKEFVPHLEQHAQRRRCTRPPACAPWPPGWPAATPSCRCRSRAWP